MAKFSLWNGLGVRSKDYKFIDRIVAEQYRIGGTEFYIHKMIGVHDQGPHNENDSLSIDFDETGTDPSMTIQDVLNMENRDRKYDPHVYSMMGHYSLNDMEFQLGQLGIMLNDDTIFITFHLNDMVDKIGRKLTAGDVIEVLHKRDDLVQGSNAAINKYYQVQEGFRPANGYGPDWLAHTWRVKCSPITDSQEFRDIMEQPLLDASGDPVPAADNSGIDAILRDVLSTRNDELKITDKIIEAADREVPFAFFQAQHFYIVPHLTGKPIVGIVDLWTGDGIPPNGSKPVAHGCVLPTSPLEGDYFLRTDYYPPQLYQYANGGWTKIQNDWRSPWQPANHLLVSFIDNDKLTTLNSGRQIPEQQNIRKVVRPRLDPDII